MTDHPDPLDDEVLSAALDGEADAATLDRLAADPAAQARQAALADAAALVGTPVAPLDPGVVDDLIAGALAADALPDDLPVDDPPAADDAVVAPLRPSRRRRPGPPPWLVAAAVVVLVVAGLGLIWSGRSSNDDKDTAAQAPKTTGAPTATSESNGAADSGSRSGDAGAGAPSTTTTLGAAPSSAPQVGESPDTEAPSLTGPLRDLGTFPSADAFRQATRRSLPAGGARTGKTYTAKQASRCAGVLESSPLPVTKVTDQAVATIRGQRLLVFQLQAEPDEAGNPRSIVVAVDVTDCGPRDGITFFQDR